mgnify:CR=1 FL=1
MVVNFVKKLKFILFLSFFIALSFQIVNSKSDNDLLIEPILTIDQDPKTQKLSFHISPEVEKDDYTQTLSYLSNDKLIKQLSEVYEYHQQKFEALGKEALSRFVVDPIKKEFELKDDYYVFYHGQKREFLLIQDLFARLNELVRKKALKDFVMLRIPDKDYKKFKNVKQFLGKYKDEMKNFIGWFDGQDHIYKILLAVNPFLFGNTSMIWGGECSFAYFLGSDSIAWLDIFNLAKNVFKYFDLEVNWKYERPIKELMGLLSTYEKNKTGVLLQIFVPKKIVDEISYRCIPGGNFYYKDSINEVSSKDLSKYQKNKKWFSIKFNKYISNNVKFAKYYSALGYYAGCGIPLILLGKLLKHERLVDFIRNPLRGVSNKCLDYGFKFLNKSYKYQTFYSPISSKNIDRMQFRILLNEDIMLNPDSGVKIFRYCNETELVKEYKKKLDKLFADISKDKSFCSMAGA